MSCRTAIALLCWLALAGGAACAAPALVDRAVATVNGEIITLSETREAAWGMTGQARVLSESDSRELAAALDDVIDLRLLVQAAGELKIQTDKEAIDRSVNAVTKAFHDRFPDEDSFQAFLDQNGMSVDSLRDQIRDRETQMQLIRRALSGRVVITNEDVTSYEARLRAEGQETDFFFLDQIVIAFPPEPAPDAETAAYQRATQIAARLQRGEDFAKVAQEASDDKATAARGGSLGWIARRDLRKELAGAVLPLESDQVTQPARTPAGYHILRLRARRDARSQLLERKIAEARHSWVAELRRKADIRYIPYQEEQATSATATRTSDTMAGRSGR